MNVKGSGMEISWFPANDAKKVFYPDYFASLEYEGHVGFEPTTIGCLWESDRRKLKNPLFLG